MSVSRRRISYEQFSALVEFMEAHPNLAKNRLNTVEGRHKVYKLWAQLATTLNSIGNGTCKNAKGWSKYFSDVKSKIKKKNAHAGGAAPQPGAGAADAAECMTELETRLLGVLGADFGCPLQGDNTDVFADEDYAPTEKLVVLCAPTKESHSDSEEEQTQQEPEHFNEVYLQEPRPPPSPPRAPPPPPKRPPPWDPPPAPAASVSWFHAEKRMRKASEQLDTVGQFGQYVTGLVRRLPRAAADRVQLEVVTLVMAALAEAEGAAGKEGGAK